MSDKINTNYSTVNPKSLITEEVKKIIKVDINQAQKITEYVNLNYTLPKFFDEKKFQEEPLLRAPLEQKKSNESIDLETESQYKTKTFPEKEDHRRDIKENKPQSDGLTSEDKKEQLLVNQKHFYDDNHLPLSAFMPTKEMSDLNHLAKIPTNKSTIEDGSTPHFPLNSPENKKSSEHYEFLYLQLSYQNLINKNILDKIKDTDKFDYYLEKLNKLSKGVEGLRNEFKPILENVNKYKDAYIDYWMEINKEIKENKLISESDIANLLKNKNIINSVIKDLLHSKIHSRDEMEAFLTKHFPFMDLPDDISKYTLDNLYGKLANFLDNAFKYMPDVAIDKSKLPGITSHQAELENLINKKQDININNKLASASEQYSALIGEQSKIELEAMADTLSGMALLTFLLAKVRELTMKVMLERSEGEQKLFDEMQEVTTQSLKDKIADQKAQIKKQEEIQYWAGIGLKILGGLLTLIAGVAAIFTAGASMALVGVAVVMMAASVTLTVADEIYKAVNDKSFMEEAMAPVTEAIGEAIDKISDFIIDMIHASMDILERMGVNKNILEDAKKAMQDKLKMAVKIITTIALLVGGVALSFVAGSAANAVTSVAKNIFTEQIKETLKRVLNDFLEAMLGKMVKQIIVETMQNIFNKISKILSNELTTQGIKMINRAVIMSKLATAAASSTVNIYTATITDKIIKSIADSKKLEEILKLIQLLMDKLMESYHDHVDTLTEILKEMSDQSSISSKTKANIVRNISI